VPQPTLHWCSDTSATNPDSPFPKLLTDSLNLSVGITNAATGLTPPLLNASAILNSHNWEPHSCTLISMKQMQFVDCAALAVKLQTFVLTLQIWVFVFLLRVELFLHSEQNWALCSYKNKCTIENEYQYLGAKKNNNNGIRTNFNQTYKQSQNYTNILEEQKKYSKANGLSNNSKLLLLKYVLHTVILVLHFLIKVSIPIFYFLAKLGFKFLFLFITNAIASTSVLIDQSQSYGVKRGWASVYCYASLF